MKFCRVLPLAVGCFLLAGCHAAPSDNGGTATAEIGDVISLVEDNGTVVHRDPYSIYATVNGKILSCQFEEGNSVQTGDILYILDSTDLEDQITQAELSLQSAQQSYEQSAAACQDLTVQAKASGTVTALHVHVGDYVSAGTPIADVTDRATMTLTVPFATADAAAIFPGAAAEISFVSYSGTASGTVRRVYDTPSSLSGGREGTYVEIAFQNPGALSGGETAAARVGTAACMDTGQVETGTSQSLYATQSGQVLSLSIDTGSAVSVGQTIMTIKNDSLTNARDNARLSVETAATNLAQLERKRADYTLTAPADGIMVSRSAKEGDYATAATPLATLAQEDSLGVDVSIDEIYIDKIFQGQEATVTFTDDAGQERSYTAQVHQVSETGVTSGGVTNYTVELTLDNTEGLRSGMNVMVSIETARRENCLRIPTAALNGSTVQVQNGSKTEERTVETGLSGGGYTEILSGLSEGEVVLLP